MIRGLFTRLTGAPNRGEAPFQSAVAEARREHWYVAGAVPDTVEGRFAMLATVIAMITVRLERSGRAGGAATVGLTERFIESMDAEIRQMGVGDPKLGRQVRSLVGALANRVEHWRGAIDGTSDWTATVVRSVYRDESPSAEAAAHSASALRELWLRLQQTSTEDIAEGRLG